MPTYKTEYSMIERAILSVQKQQITYWELIIVDDNPKNSNYKLETKLAEKRYAKESRIQWVYHEDNKGANAARNSGLKIATGKYMAFLDSDDVWDKEYLKQIQKCFMDDDEIGIVSCAYRIVTKSKTIDVISDHDNGYIYDEEVYGDLLSPTSAVVVKREILVHIEGFDENLPARQDYDTWLRVCEKNKVAFLRTPLVSIYRNGHESISNRSMNHINGTLMVLEKLLSKPELKDKKEKIEYYHYKYIAKLCMIEGRFELARKYYCLCLDYEFNCKLLIAIALSYFPIIYKYSRKTVRILKRKE